MQSLKKRRSLWHLLGVMYYLWRIKRLYPDLRLGQILANAVYASQKSFDPFHIEDDALRAALKAHHADTRRWRTREIKP